MNICLMDGFFVVKSYGNANIRRGAANCSAVNSMGSGTSIVMQSV